MLASTPAAAAMQCVAATYIVPSATPQRPSESLIFTAQLLPALAATIPVQVAGIAARDPRHAA